MRIKNKELCESYRFKPCLVCGNPNEVCGHHIKSKGSGGDDIDENLMPLCFNHHTEIHQIGLNKFIKKYGNVKWYLLERGWYYCHLRERFYNDNVFAQH